MATTVTDTLINQIKVLDDALDSLANDFNEEVGHLRLLIADIEKELKQ